MQAVRHRSRPWQKSETRLLTCAAPKIKCITESLPRLLVKRITGVVDLSVYSVWSDWETEKWRHCTCSGVRRIPGAVVFLGQWEYGRPLVHGSSCDGYR
jgi:hypothetical protein